MNPKKLLACLVALIAIRSLPLSAAEVSDARTWTDVQGRTIEARLINADATAGTIEIERADGAHFTLPVSRLSAQDQVFVREWAARQTPAPAASAATAPSLQELTQANWDWLARCGSIQPAVYKRISPEDLGALINRRLQNSPAPAGKGAITRARIDIESGGDEISIEVRTIVSLSTFLRDLARQNNLVLQVDSGGNLVIQRQPSKKSDIIEFLGVSSS